MSALQAATAAAPGSALTIEGVSNKVPTKAAAAIVGMRRALAIFSSICY